MWIVAGVLLGLVLFSSIFGFHIGPHAHTVAAITGITAAGFLIAIIATGDTRSFVFLLLSTDVVVSTGVAVIAWRGLTDPGLRGRTVNSLVSKEGIAVSDLEPSGIVRVAGENWSAISLNGRIQAGTRIQVIEANGVRLSVWGDQRLPQEAASSLALDKNSPSVGIPGLSEGTH
jgi:membrane-bound ClpP family serine protease